MGAHGGGGSPPYRIGGLDHIVLRVADMDRAIAFYRDVIGAHEERRVEKIGLVQMRAGGSLIDLVPAGDAPPPGAERGNVEHFALTVSPFDADAIRDHLERHNVTAGEVAERYGAQGHGPSLYLADPDGNQIELKGPATD